MTPNLQIELRRFISSNVVSKLNKFYFENDALLIKGIDVSIGTILMGLYNKASESGFYKEMIDLIKEDSSFYQEVDFTSGRILSVDDCYRVEGNPILKEYWLKVCNQFSFATLILTKTKPIIINKKNESKSLKIKLILDYS